MHCYLSILLFWEGYTTHISHPLNPMHQSDYSLLSRSWAWHFSHPHCNNFHYLFQKCRIRVWIRCNCWHPRQNSIWLPLSLRHSMNNPTFQAKNNRNLFLAHIISGINEPVSPHYWGTIYTPTSTNISLKVILTYSHNITSAWLQVHIIIYIHKHKFTFLYY